MEYHVEFFHVGDVSIIAAMVFSAKFLGNISIYVLETTHDRLINEGYTF